MTIKFWCLFKCVHASTMYNHSSILLNVAWKLPSQIHPILARLIESSIPPSKNLHRFPLMLKSTIFYFSQMCIFLKDIFVLIILTAFSLCTLLWSTFGPIWLTVFTELTGQWYWKVFSQKVKIMIHKNKWLRDLTAAVAKFNPAVLTFTLKRCFNWGVIYVWLENNSAGKKPLN